MDRQTAYRAGDDHVADSDRERGIVATWAAGERRIRPRRFSAEAPALRFAFYGRMSTVDYQDRDSSWRWQRDYATDLIAGHGRIVVEYFDEGVSRRVAWPDRPHAAQLLTALTDPGRGFDAIVVGEYERAFTAQQVQQLTPMLRKHGVGLWLPETYGPVDFDNPRHLAVIDLLGVRSQREVSRARYRTMAAMRAQAETQGRHLGGRPPYGYRLVDAGPHPNRAHAAWGRRLHRLDPDPVTALHVRWIFEQRLARWSVACIARELNERGVPCPSGADPDRNRHRSGAAWMVTTVAAILANPRYTGRQVWNRQRTDRDHVDGQGELFREQEVQRRTSPSQWVISRTVVHPPLISEEQFVRVQAVRTAPVPADGVPRGYPFAGLVYCGICGRLMDSHWVHERASYRCRHGRTSARPAGPGRPKILYVREDHLLARIQGDRLLRRQLTELAGLDTVAACLRTNNMIIVCDHDVWAVESDTTRIELAPVASLTLTTPAVPAPRRGHTAATRPERPSRSVWK
jgi:DNA invertase Pin-like site-specific DNA recombinase